MTLGTIFVIVLVLALVGARPIRGFLTGALHEWTS
jgi:hypothetical protein